jgi:ribosomal protein L37AE/L43A
MSYVDLPDVGRIWQCGSCLKGLESDSGEFYEWSDPLSQENAAVAEIRTESKNPCPECGRSMLEVMTEGFGSRWQCESCRLTVYSSGGIQRWGPPKRGE